MPLARTAACKASWTVGQHGHDLGALGERVSQDEWPALGHHLTAKSSTEVGPRVRALSSIAEWGGVAWRGVAWRMVRRPCRFLPIDADAKPVAYAIDWCLRLGGGDSQVGRCARAADRRYEGDGGQPHGCDCARQGQPGVRLDHPECSALRDGGVHGAAFHPARGGRILVRANSTGTWLEDLSHNTGWGAGVAF